MTTLASSGADALLLGVTSLPCPNALKAVQRLGLDAAHLRDADLLVQGADGRRRRRRRGHASAPAPPTTPPTPPAPISRGVVEFKEQGAAAGPERGGPERPERRRRLELRCVPGAAAEGLARAGPCRR